MTVACFGMGLSLEEALIAATLNAAASLDLAAETGSLEVGKRADHWCCGLPACWTSCGSGCRPSPRW